MKRRSGLGLLALSALLLASPVFAGGDIASLTRGAHGLLFHNLAANGGGSLVVTGPGGFSSQQDFAAASVASFELSADMADGLYSYELVLSPRIDSATRRAMDRARAAGDAAAARALAASLRIEPISGSFTVSNGAIVNDQRVESVAAVSRAGSGFEATSGAAALDNVNAAAQTITTDLIVQGSECVGVDCVSSESFGFDTLRLKENNLRIHFNDTSSSASFPSNDWRIVANDSTNGGGNYLAIEDSTAGTQPFRVDAGAGANAMRIESGGNVGIGNSNPVVELHVTDGDSPTLRLEQNGSSGFTPQTWDVAGNEANFFVRDVTNGSKLPFKIKPGAPDNSIFIDSDGDVAIGATSTDAALDINRSTDANATMIQLTNNAPVAIQFNNTDLTNIWEIRRSGSGLAIDNDTNSSDAVFFDTGRVRFRAAGGATTFDLSDAGALTIAGDLTANGIVTASDVNLKRDFSDIDGEEILAKLASLPVTTWAFRSAPGVRHIGPMAQDFRAAFGFGDRETHISVSDLGGLSLAAIQELHRQLEEKQAKMEALESQNADLLERLEALEAKLAP